MVESSEYLRREKEISEMIREIEKVDVPSQIIDVSQVPEFDVDAAKKGNVIVVAQAQMGSTESLPIRTDNLDKCVAMILRVPSEDGTFKIFLVHIQDGDLQSNADGHKEEDVKKVLHGRSEAIFIHSDRSYTTGQSSARLLAYSGLATEKIINPHGGNALIDVVYRPLENQLYVRVKSSNEIQVFEGFK